MEYCYRIKRDEHTIVKPSFLVYCRCILTPNQIEFERLVEAVQRHYSAQLQEQQQQQLSEQRKLEIESLLANLNSACGGVDTCSNTPSVVTPIAEATAAANTEALDARRVYALSAALGGVTILKKGKHDIVASSRTTATELSITGVPGVDSVYVIKENGSPRRCGGQGDILSGTLGVTFYWALKVITFPHRISCCYGCLVDLYCASSV